jgi:hypothetical protein
MSSTVTITQETFNLHGYGGTIENVKPLTPFSADTPVKELRARFNEDGVLWVRSSLL